jgi:hypothetical protein
MTSPAPPLTHEDYKCWICLGTADEPPPHGLPRHDWKRPCRCNLVAHQTCLLDWAAEVASANARSLVIPFQAAEKLPQCPQCKAPIRISKSVSKFILLREAIEAANATGFQVFFCVASGGSLASAMYTSLYAIGAASIRCLCPTDMALQILGVTVTEGGVFIQPLSLRRFILIPAIPLALLLSGSQSRFADVVTLALPLGLADKHHLPWKFTGARLTVALLPVARILYHMAYDVVVEPIIQRCAARVRPSYIPQVANDGQRLLRHGVNIEIVVEEEILQNGNQDGGEQDEQDDVQRLDGVNRQGMGQFLINQAGNWFADAVDRAIPLEPEDAAPPVDRPADGVAEQEDAQNGPPQLPRRRGADWVFSTQALSLRVGNALILPLLSGLMGAGLSLVPGFRRLIPSRFNRNIFGGLLVILLRDIVNVSTALLKVAQERSRRVLEYDEA